MKNNNNEFLELVSSPLMNLEHSWRYSGTKLVEKESLSQHIVDTIMMGIKICDEINTISQDTLNVERYVMKATFHDLEEVITGDVPRPLKYFNDDTRDSLKGVADDVAFRLFNKEFHYAPEFYELWRDAKEGKEGFILKIVDTLVVANKVVKEVTFLNNNYMLRVAHEVSCYLTELHDYVDSGHAPFEDTQVVSYISKLLSGAIDSMKDILKKNKDVMAELNIYGQSMI